MKWNPIDEHMPEKPELETFKPKYIGNVLGRVLIRFTSGEIEIFSYRF